MRVSVKLKLGLAFGVVIALSIVAGGVAYSKLSSLNDTIDQLSNHEAEGPGPRRADQGRAASSTFAPRRT